MSSDTICHHLAQISHRAPDRIAVRYRAEDWNSLTWPEYYEMIEAFALALKELGVQPKDPVAIFAATRLEWAIADLAIMGMGAVAVAVYPNVTAEDLQFMLNKSETKFLIAENQRLLRTFTTVKSRCPLVQDCICMDPSEASSQSEHLDFWSLIERGKILRASQSQWFSESCKQQTPETVATILFTSGTSGLPKGVVLSHRQILSEVVETFGLLGISPKDISLSFLPYAHVMGRIEHWCHIYHGFTMAFAESIEKLRDNLIEVKPTFLVAVPRIFEKFYGIIQSKFESNPLSKELSQWSMGVGRHYSQIKVAREPIPVSLALQYELAKKLILNRVKDAFGGRIRFAISGGAPISKDMAEFFHACDLLVLEGYGLTETTAAICVNSPFDYAFGTVGKPIGDVQIKIAQDGEILVKSDKVMLGYFKDPQATKEVLIDGWFHTGDIGEFTNDGHLRITDRKKDLIKTAGGKYVAPQRIENLLKLHPFVSHVLVHGDQRKYIVALIALDTAFLKNFSKERNIEYNSMTQLTQHKEVLELVRKAVAETNAQLASFETIKRFSVLTQDFSVESGELTPSLKVKRKYLDKKFAHQIDALYS